LGPGPQTTNLETAGTVPRRRRGGVTLMLNR
jgi:hypothetical protein